MDNIDKLADIVKNSERIVFFGGAGVSTESGIPDFRSVDGLYNQQWNYPQSYLLYGKDRGILPFLQSKNALSHSKAQCCSSQTRST